MKHTGLLTFLRIQRNAIFCQIIKFLLKYRSRYLFCFKSFYFGILSNFKTYLNIVLKTVTSNTLIFFKNLNLFISVHLT